VKGQSRLENTTVRFTMQHKAVCDIAALVVFGSNG